MSALGFILSKITLLRLGREKLPPDERRFAREGQHFRQFLVIGIRFLLRRGIVGHIVWISESYSGLTIRLSMCISAWHTRRREARSCRLMLFKVTIASSMAILAKCGGYSPYWQHEEGLLKSLHPLIREEVEMPLTIVTPLAVPSYEKSDADLEAYIGRFSEGTRAKQEYCKRHGYTLESARLLHGHPEWHWAMLPSDARENTNSL